MAMACSLRSTSITPASSLLRSSPPPVGASVFRPRGWRRLCLFPWHRRLGSHVPYKSLVELRAAYMPDAARAVSVSGISRADPGGRVTPRFRHRLIRFRHFIDGSLALASLNLTRRDILPTLTATLTTIAFDDSSLQRFEART